MLAAVAVEDGPVWLGDRGDGSPQARADALQRWAHYTEGYSNSLHRGGGGRRARAATCAAEAEAARPSFAYTVGSEIKSRIGASWRRADTICIVLGELCPWYIKHETAVA